MAIQLVKIIEEKTKFLSFVFIFRNKNLFANSKKGLDGVNTMHRNSAWNDDIDSALFDQGSSAYKSWLTK